MATRTWQNKAAADVWKRLEPRIAEALADHPDRVAKFEHRYRAQGARLLTSLHALYGWTYDFHWHLEQTILVAARSFAARPADLTALDAERETNPAWFQSERALGGVAYVDRFAGDLDGIRAKIPYLKRLGITYLHLMPLFATPAGENDGGYAVSDYRRVDPRLGTMEELRSLAGELRAAGISLVLDFILNHTSDEHPWAVAAKSGDEEAQAFYWMFDDRRTPDRLQPHLRAIFPERGGDSFTWRPDVPGPHGGKWVWTTFYTFQWDLNYRNPALLAAMAGEMLFLANQGVEVLRLDAVPFLWKEPGTNCENRPEAHTVVAALNAIAALAAPALIFKSEAIVHPDEVVRFISPEECRLSYNPLAMALAWEALATSDVRMLKDALARRHALPGGTAWVNYLRSHDDIGWGFADEDAARLGVDAKAHRDFLNAFYAGRFPGSFASGLPFQENPETGDCRVCGTLASLAGLEEALRRGDASGAETAVRRILMLHGLIMTLGGLPLLYLGDEVAQLNDYGYRDRPGQSGDARWAHRPAFPGEVVDLAAIDPQDPRLRVFEGVLRLVEMRRATPALAGGDLAVVETGSPHVLAYVRTAAGRSCLVVANFSAAVQRIDDAPLLALLSAKRLADVAPGGSDTPAERQGRLTVEPYGFHCFTAAG